MAGALNDEASVQQLVVTTPARASEADFDALVGPHLEAGYRTALAMLRDPDAAHDAVQDAAFKAWRRIRQLHDTGSARAWFLTIVANQCRSARRGRWWSVLRLPEVEPAEQEFTTDKPDLARALARLPQEDRLALFLHFYLAENSTKSTGQVDAQAAPTTTIRRVSDGSVAATIDGSMGVLAFSADNSTALVTLAPWVGGQPAHVGVVNLATGNVVWQDDGTALFGGVIVKPCGVGFALSYPTSAQGPGPATVVLVGGDGSWTKLQGPYAPTW